MLKLINENCCCFVQDPDSSFVFKENKIYLKKDINLMQLLIYFKKNSYFLVCNYIFWNSSLIFVLKSNIKKKKLNDNHNLIY